METLKAAVIGRTKRGDYGHGLDEVWLDLPGVQLVAVADDDKQGLAATAKKLKVDKAFSDYRQMLDQLKPDVVSICPRWLDQHQAMVVDTAQRGIHMYLEKPLCRTLAEADQMIAECERTHAKLAIAHTTRYSPKIPVVQQMIASGKIGRVLELRGRGKEDQRGGGEDLWVLGTHIMDLIRLLGGDPQSCYGLVTQAGRPVTKADVQEGNEGIGPLAGDAVSATYTLPEAMAYFASMRGTSGRRPRFGLQIFGSAGILEMTTGYLPSVKYLDDPSWSPAMSGAKWQNVTSAGLGQTEPLSDTKDHGGNRAAVLELLSAIRDNRQPNGNIYDARAAVEMIAAVFESHRQGKPVPLPLANRQNPLAML